MCKQALQVILMCTEYENRRFIPFLLTHLQITEGNQMGMAHPCGLAAVLAMTQSSTIFTLTSPTSPPLLIFTLRRFYILWEKRQCSPSKHPHQAWRGYSESHTPCRGGEKEDNHHLSNYPNSRGNHWCLEKARCATGTIQLDLAGHVAPSSTP